jgi:hypothetical protein
MRVENLFFLTALLTLLAIRFSIYISRYFMPEKHLMIGKYIFHHFWFGFLLIIIALLVANETAKIILLGIGFGPIIDELVFMIAGGGGFAYYWAPVSYIGAMLMAVILFALRSRILGLLVK